MKWRYFILTLFTLTVSFNIAQEDTNSTINNYNTYFVSENTGSLASNHLPLNFFRRIIKGGEILDSDKGSTQNQNSNRRTGIELDLMYGVKWLDPKKNKGYFMNFQQLITGAGQYEQGLFNIIFLGNSVINSPLQLNKTSFHFRKHHILHFGLTRNQFEFGIALGNILNEYQGKFNSDDQLSFISPFLWEISITPDFLFLDNNPNSIRKNGNSIGFDLAYYSKNNDSKNYSYNLSLKNLGVMYLHQNLTALNFDTSFNYTGFKLEEILNSNETITELSEDFGISNYDGTELQITPFTFNANYQYHFTNANIYSNLFYRHKSQFLPRLNLGYEKIINQKISAGTNLTYGGYNKLQWGSNIACKLNNINANLQVYNLLGFAPKIGKSFGIQLKIQWLVF